MLPPIVRCRRAMLLLFSLPCPSQATSDDDWTTIAAARMSRVYRQSLLFDLSGYYLPNQASVFLSQDC